MNYNKIYNDLIESRRFLNRTKNDGIYYEKHHILPKSLGGSNYIENLILLTPREHFIAHMLLYKGAKDIRTKRKMSKALGFMMKWNNETISSKKYEIIRNILSDNMKGENNPMFGKLLSDKHKQKISNGLIGRIYLTGEHSLMFGKHLSDDSRKKISIANSGEKNGMYNRKGDKHPWTGQKHKKESKEKISNALKNIPKEKRSTYGKCWINNGIKNKMVKFDDLEQYLNCGWFKGRLTK